MFFNFLSKDDIFISYSRRDGASYAAGLADELTAKKFSCFIDKLGTEPDRDLPPSLRRTIRSCTLFVVVGTECGAASEFVAKEIEEFKKTRRTIVPIDFGGAVGRARWYGLIPGLAAEPEENADARRAGDPSPNVVNRIEKSFNYTRRNQRMMRILVFTLSLFFVLITASGIAAYVANSNIKEARRQSRAAEEATVRAQEKTKIAAEASARAEEQTRRAEDATRRAEEATHQAKDAERLRDLAEKKTAEANRLERQARAHADEQQKRADLQQRRANEQQLRAEEQLKRSTNLVYASNILVAQQSHNTGRADYGQGLLDSYQPGYIFAKGAGDLRGFEWRYLWRVYHKRYEPDPDRLRPTAAAFSPDGRWLAAADRHGRLMLWDTSEYFYNASNTTLTESGGGGRLGQSWQQELSVAMSVLTFSPDSKLLAAGTIDGRLQLFEVATRRPLPLEIPSHDSAVTSLVFSPDGQTLAASFEAGPPVFWDVASRRQSETPGALSVDASALAYSPDGKWLALGQGSRVSLWGLAGGRAPLVLDTGALVVKRLSFSPDSRLLAATAADGKARVWDIASRRQVEAASRLDGQAEVLAFSPDGRMIATVGANSDEAKLWDASTYQEIETLTIAAPREAEKKAAVDEARRRRMAKRQQEFPPGLRVHDLAFSPDSETLAGWGGLEALVLWSTSRNPVVLDAESFVADATYSPDGKAIVTADDNGTVNVWDALKRTRVRSFQALKGESGSSGNITKPIFAFSADGRTLAVSSGDGGSVTLLETGSYTELFTFEVGAPDDDSESVVTALAFSSDGSRLAVGVGQGTNLYDATKLRGPSPPVPIARLMEDTDPVVLSDENDPSDVSSLVFLSGGQVLVAGSMYMVRLWDVKTHALLRKFPFSWAHEGSLGRLTLSPDGRQLAVSTRFWLRLYDVGLLISGDARKYLDLSGPGVLTGKLSFSPDGKTLASGMEDGSVKLWNTVAGQELITLRGHQGEVKAVAFSPDGMALVTGGDSTLKLWLAATDTEVRAQRTPQVPGD